MTAFSDETGRGALSALRETVEYFDFFEFKDEHIVFSEYAERKVTRLTVGHLRIAVAALSASPVAQEPVARLCGYCKTWNSKPCGEQCYLSPSDPVWTSPPATSAGVGADEIARACDDLRGIEKKFGAP